MTSPIPQRTAKIGALLGVAFLAWLVSIWLLGSVSPRTARIVSESAFLVFGSFAVVCCLAAARAAVGRARTAWTCVTIGAACWVFADVFKASYASWSGEAAVPFPSIADAGFIALPISVCVAFLLLPVGHSGLSTAQLLMDGLIVAGSLFLIIWVLILRGLFDAGHASPFAFFVTLAYPLLDLIAITVGVLVLIRAKGAARLQVALLLGAIVMMGVSNDVYFRLVAENAYNRGDLLDASWAASMLALGGAALSSFRVQRFDTRPAKASAWLPYVPFALSGAVVVWDVVTPVSAVALTVATALVVAVLLRQFLVVGQNQRLLAVVADQALRDPLTGLANRLLFQDRLTHAVDLHKRELFGVLAVMSLDLNDFKLVNDGLGHAAGDELLTEVAKRLIASVRSGDTVARLGGDEFAILIEQGTDRPDLVAQRVVEAFDVPFVIDGHALFIRPSVGLSVASARDLDLRADVLLQQSDLAMYAAKRTGTSGVHTFAPDMHPRHRTGSGVRRAPDARDGAGIELLGDLRRAIDDGDLTTVYQPKIDLRADAVVGVEALVRWPHPELGLLEPAEFLPVVRRNGLMNALTEVVLDKALADMAKWRDDGHLVPVAVNLFAPSFDDEDLPARLNAALSARGLPCAALTLEITEDLVLKDFERTRTVLERLRESGIRVSVDDFGSGYSGLQYLRDLTIDEVKLDREFILPIVDDPRAASIVRAIIGLTHELQLVCVAEGVENVALVDRLREYGCDVAQGYYYSPPVAAPLLLDRLSTLGPLVMQP